MTEASALTGVPKLPNVADQSEAALLAELRGLRVELGPIKGKQGHIYARRLELFTELDARGIGHDQIADAFGVTAAAVGVALHKKRNQAEPAEPWQEDLDAAAKKAKGQ